MKYDEATKIIWGPGVDSFTRFQAFINIASKLNSRDYWRTLRDAYDTSDNLYPYRGLVRAAFMQRRPHKHCLMTTEEREYLNSLPDQLTIYRGMTEEELRSQRFGISWTLKKEVAEFFAHAYQRNHSTAHLAKAVHELHVSKKEVIAFLNGRDEFEIIYIPVEAEN